MKISVRKGVFETNSSNTHSPTVCLKSEYDDWKAGKLLFDAFRKTFVDLDTFEFLKTHEFKASKFDASSYLTYEQYYAELKEDLRDLLTFEKKLKTPLGDVIVLGYSGFDG